MRVDQIGMEGDVGTFAVNFTQSEMNMIEDLAATLGKTIEETTDLISKKIFEGHRIVSSTELHRIDPEY